MKCLNPVPAWSVKNGEKEKLYFSPPSFAPFASPTYMLPCGKCPLCLESRRQDWIRRITIESWLHANNTFITLTFDDNHLPIGGLATKEDVQRFLKRFRHASRDFNIPSFEFKYFIVSEYGEKFGRPHFHGILFGLDLMSPEWQPYFALLKPDGNPVYSSRILERIWRNGFVSLDRLTPHNIAYVVKYINKSDSRPSVRLYSRGFGKSIFFDRHNNLTSFGRNSFQNGFIVYPFGNGRFFKSSIPKNIERYLSLYDEDFFRLVKSKRRDFSKAKVVERSSLLDSLDNLKIKQGESKKKRILDNET